MVPIEEAMVAFTGTAISKKEMEKGIPLISFVIKEGEGAVFIKPLPLFAAGSILKDQGKIGGEILYRADYLQGGREIFATGVLIAGERPETFLKLLGDNISSGNAKADIMGIYSYLEAHLILCGLERLAQEEITFMGKEEAGNAVYREANSAYYREVLSFVETGRRCLNTSQSGISLPPFPQRSEFMAKWYREHTADRAMPNEAGQEVKE
ncbi:hypothetical protein AALB47_23240 [Lachnospiraceae bacterium 54-11]